MRFISSFLIVALISSTCLAAPIGGEVIRGSSDISYDPSRVEINQHTDRAVIDWRSFDLKAGEHIKFNLPNPSSVALNRINDRKASEINGLVSSNGNLILLNPNGIVFGKDAVVDAAGIIASSSKVNIDEFMNGGAFGFTSDNAGKIINKGKISSQDHGLVGLVSPHLENHGIISATLGKVQLASSDSYTVDLAGDGLINLAISDHQKQKIENNGKINAYKGRILLTASAAREIIDSLIINNGKIEAKTGSIKIYAEGANAVADNVAANKGIKAGQSAIINNGTIDASGKLTVQKGGTIELLADDIALLDNSKIDASGNLGGLNTYQNNDKSDARLIAAGGDIKIGGDYLGSGTTPAAKNVYVAPNAKIYADSLDSGDAGRVIIWADKQNDFYGNVFVRGGKRSGDGGFVETSGKEKLNAHGYVTTLAPNGKRGTYLLDPTSISIYGSTTGNWPTFNSTDGSTVQLNAKLLFWVDGADPLGNNGASFPTSGNKIATWYDKSSGGKNLTQGTSGNQPSWYSNSQNGLGQVRFAGNHWMTNSLNIASSTPFYFLTGQTNNGSTQFFFDSTNAGQRQAIAVGVGGINSLGLYSGNVVAQADGIFTPRIIGAQFGASAVLYFNGISSLTGNSGSYTLSGITLGGMYNLSGGNFLNGSIDEIITYSSVNTNERNVLEQYNSAKWAIALNPLNNGHTEIVQATTDGAYSVFTTRYLERLAASADISLTAGSGGILLDLQGDTLALPSETNLTLTTTGTGDITNNSIGTIVATRTSSKGNITLNSNGNINFTSPMTFKTNGGDFTLSASGTASVNTLTVDTTNNGALTTGNITINKSISATASSGNSIILAAGNSFNIGANTLAASGTARYLVYSKQASSNTPNSTPGGATAVYSTNYPTIPGTSGNLYIYSTAAPILPYLTITADNKFKFYNWPNPTFTYTVSGLLNGDQPSIVSGITLTSTAVTGSLPGIYSITPSGGTVSGAYTIGTYTPGTITVIKTPPANKCPCLTALGR